MEPHASLCNVPILHDNETLYSWCAMSHALNAGTNAVATSIALFGSPSAALLHDFPSHLNILVSRFGCALPDARHLALRHTLVGYFLPLHARPASEEFLSTVCAGALPSIKMRLGITASRVGGYHPLKSCRECIRSDQEDNGVAYWRIEHQWPSAMVCLNHQRPLTMAWDPITPVHRREWAMPGNCPTASLIEVPVLGDIQLARLLQLAQFSQCLALSDPAAFEPRSLAQTYQARLRTLGLATVRGNLKLKRLLEVARGRYGGIDAVPGFESLRAIGPDWPGLVGTLSRRAPRPGHPLKHLLMIAMLFDSWEEFLTAYSTASDRDRGPPNVATPQRDVSVEENLYQLVVNEHCSITEAASRLHICTTTGTQIARRLGIAFTPRPKRIHHNRLQDIRRLLLCGMPVAVVAARTFVSVGSVNRILAADEHLAEVRRVRIFLAKRKDARKNFCDWMRTFPGLQVNQLRKIPGNPYMWLYRHDRQWLQQSIPSLWTLPMPTTGETAAS